MDNIRFYQCPPCSSPKKREHAASTNPDPTSRPFLEISLSREIANDHVEDGQAVTQGRLHKPATSFVSAIERQRIVAEEEIGASSRPSSPDQNESSPVVEDSPLVQSSLGPPRPQTSDIRSDSKVDESFASPQLPLLQNATIDDHTKEQMDQACDIHPERESVYPSSDIQYDGYSAQKSAANAQTRLEHPTLRQDSPCQNFNNDHSSASTEIPCDQVRGYVDQADTSRSIYESIFRGTQVTVPKLLGAGHDASNSGAAGPEGQTPDSASDAHGCGITGAPRFAMAVENHFNSVSSIHNDGMPSGHAMESSLPPGSDTGDQVRDTYSGPLPMPSQPPTPTTRTASRDVTIYPLQQMDLCILTAVASSVPELQQLCEYPDVWPIPQNISPFDHLTILGIKPLGDQLWLLLAISGSRSTDSREGVDGHHTQTKRKREIVRVVGSDDDSESDEYDMPRRSTKTRRAIVNAHNREGSIDPAGGGVSRLKRGNWQEREDQELTRLVELGQSWSSIVARFPQRSEAAVRSRWYCVLKPLVS